MILLTYLLIKRFHNDQHLDFGPQSTKSPPENASIPRWENQVSIFPCWKDGVKKALLQIPDLKRESKKRVIKPSLESSSTEPCLWWRCHLRRLKPDLYPRPVIRHSNPQPFILSLPTNGLYARLDEISAVFLDPVSAGSRHAVIGRTSRRTS